MKKFGCLGIIILCILIGSCFGSNDTQNQQSATIENTTSSDSSNSEKSLEEILAENKKELQQVEPQRQETEDHVLAVLTDYNITSPKNVIVSDTNGPIFSISIETKSSTSSDEEHAKAEGIAIINKLLSSNMPYTIDKYDVIISDKVGSPLAWIVYAPENKTFSLLKDGKLEQIQP